MDEPRDACLGLLRERRERCGLECIPIPLQETRRWVMAGGALRHDTGGFFSVVGVRGTIHTGADSSRARPGELSSIEQPLIHQPEIGILGILLRTRGGRAEILVQAKAEPGNVDSVQLSPTVQATESNYRRLHGGAPTPYLEYFTRSGSWTVAADTLQSEQGTRFLGKYNRNVTVRVRDDGPDPVSESWRWCDMADVARALGRDFCVNTDLRSVLASSDWRALAGGATPFSSWRGTGGRGEALLDSYLAPDASAENRIEDLVQSIEQARSSTDVAIEIVPLHDLHGWSLGADAIRDGEARRFEVAGFRVRAPDREVPAWDQPLVRDLAEGEVVLVAQRRRGVLHFLLRPSFEIGFREKAQYGPSWQRAPKGEGAAGGKRGSGGARGSAGGVASAGDEVEPADGALAELLSGREATERLSCWQSEEGGRFYRSASRYRIVELPEEDSPGPLLRGRPSPPGARFATLSQIRRLVGSPGLLTNEARSALALLLLWMVESSSVEGACHK
jgi:oxidase EvaA